ncbi:MAG: hypothetical protein J0I77_21005 [Rudaea sp.]|uniref:hypothetical protein n=1 Tax=unclassified Rudaea TaxID=2627037 RepID=UPI0010FA41B9|nr:MULTISPECIES: hypothetical protein [unclassified Rudaea]MBN8888206.1 hypothetical protein [Rudaea sp.]
MSDPKKSAEENFEREFDAFLREENSRLAELYRKLPHPEPDAALDTRVRDAARRALREEETATPTRVPSRKPRWLPALGIAATLVVAAGIGWRLAPHDSQSRTATTAADVASPATAPERNVKTAANPASAPAADSISASPPAPEFAKQSAPAPGSNSADALRPQPEQARADKPAQPAPAKAETRVAAKAAAPQTPPALAAQAAKEPAAFPRRATGLEAEKMIAAKPSPPAVAAYAAPAQTEQESARTAANDMPLAAPAPPPPPPPPPASPAAPAAAVTEQNAEARQGFSVAGTAQSASSAISPDPANPTRYHWDATGYVPSSAPARSGVYPPDRPPLATWIEIVRAMLRDGHRDAAKQALADLRRQHPDYRIPADLRGLE